MAYKQNNPFSRKSSSPLKALDPTAYTSYADRFANPDFNQETDDFYARELARKKETRGTNTYADVMHDRYKINRPYYKSKNSRKYPHLMSRHNMKGNMTDPMDPNRLYSIDNPETLGVGGVNNTQREYDKYIQDRLAQLSLKGLTKQQLKEFEFNAKQSSNMYDEVINNLDVNESTFDQSLKNAYNTNQFGPGSRTYNALGGPGNIVAYNTQQYIDDLKALNTRASKAQDTSDKFRNIGYDADETMRQFDQSDYRAPTMEELHSKYFGKDSRSGVNYGKGTRFNTRSGNKY